MSDGMDPSDAFVLSQPHVPGGSASHIERRVIGHFGFQRGVMVVSRSQLGLPA